MGNSFRFDINSWIILRLMIPLNKLVHILIFCEYLLDFYFIIFFTIDKRDIFTPKIYECENIDRLLLRLILIFLCRVLDILTLINTIIPFITFHFGNNNMKLSNELFMFLGFEDRIDMKKSILLTKIFLSKSDQ